MSFGDNVCVCLKMLLAEVYVWKEYVVRWCLLGGWAIIIRFIKPKHNHFERLLSKARGSRGGRHGTRHLLINWNYIVPVGQKRREVTATWEHSWRHTYVCAGMWLWFSDFAWTSASLYQNLITLNACGHNRTTCHESDWMSECEWLRSEWAGN